MDDLRIQTEGLSPSDYSKWRIATGKGRLVKEALAQALFLERMLLAAAKLDTLS